MSNVAVFHTSHGSYIGMWDKKDSVNVGGRICERVVRPALISLASSSITLIPVFKMTKSEVYTFPRDELVFGAPMEPDDSLASAYLSKYNGREEVPEIASIPAVELTTFPKE